jgi:hypothetical protein
MVRCITGAKVVVIRKKYFKINKQRKAAGAGLEGLIAGRRGTKDDRMGAFIKESRMSFAEPIRLDRKSGAPV